MPVKTGCYYIINVHNQNYAFLPNSNSWEPIQGRYKQDNAAEQWKVLDRGNGHHGIVNSLHKQFAASENRSAAGDGVVGWERDQTWLIQRTSVNGQYTIATTDSKRFWGSPDVTQGTPIELDDTYTNRRNWWMFKDVNTGRDAELEPMLDNGRTAHDTATGDMSIQAVLFELVLPPLHPPKPFEMDLVIIQEMPNEFIQNVTETANKICRPLLKSGKLKADDLKIHFIEFESLSDKTSNNKTSRIRFSCEDTFDSMRDYRAIDFPWMQCPQLALTATLKHLSHKQELYFRPSATKVLVLNVRSLPIRSGKSIPHLIADLAELGVILILTLSQPHVQDTLFDQELFRELARLSSGTILNLPAKGGSFYRCILDYLEEFDTDSLQEKFPDVAVIKPELPLSQRKHLTADSFVRKGYAEDPEDEFDSDRIDSDDDLVDDGGDEDGREPDDDDDDEEFGPRM